MIFTQYQLPWIVLVGILIPVVQLSACDERGKKIYQAQCASCHGDQGQGVAGKYKESLTGDMSLTALTEVIEDTMPADDPDLCVAEDADSVAKYIYDAFYSAEARSKTMTRIELTHRTNSQYKNSIADLLSRFKGKLWIEDGMNSRGFKGHFYSSRSFDSTKKMGERIDPQIDFDFGAGSPLSPETETEEFGIQWFAALSIEETGRYDFFVDTPNGVKLFVNDPKNPAIDAWVSTGGDSHETSVYLLAGQSYLLKLDMFKYKDKSAKITLSWKPPFGEKGLIPSRNLIPIWAPRVGVVNTSLPPDDSSSGYSRGTSISKAWLEGTSESAIEISNLILKDLKSFAQVRNNDPDKQEKLKKFCRRFATFAFTRPLTDQQKRVYIDTQFEEAETPEAATKQAIILILQSPRFLYPELGVETVDDYAVANRLALSMWDSLPDQELWSAAAGGNLAQPWGVNYQVDRLLDDPRMKAKIREFFHHWLHMEEEDLTKDKDLYPDFTAEIAADLRISLDLFLDDVVWSEDSDFRRLYTSDELFVNQRLAKYYGIPLPPNSNSNLDEFVKVSASPEQRAGVLTHPYMMTGLAYHRTTSPIHRGVFVARNLIGRTLKQPPENFEPLKEDFDPTMTTRERVAHQTKDKSCQTCHSFINPLGFSLEGYDAVGRIRQTEKKKSIDSTSVYFTENDQEVQLTGPRDLANYLINSEKAQKSFIEHLFHHIVKHGSHSYGEGTVDRLHESFVQNDLSIKQLIRDIVKLTSLHGNPAAEKLKIGRRPQKADNLVDTSTTPDHSEFQKSLHVNGTQERTGEEQ